jgi:hypothetical protein
MTSTQRTRPRTAIKCDLIFYDVALRVDTAVICLIYIMIYTYWIAFLAFENFLEYSQVKREENSLTLNAEIYEIERIPGDRYKKKKYLQIIRKD